MAIEAQEASQQRQDTGRFCCCCATAAPGCWWQQQMAFDYQQLGSAAYSIPVRCYNVCGLLMVCRFIQQLCAPCADHGQGCAGGDGQWKEVSGLHKAGHTQVRHTFARRVLWGLISTPWLAVEQGGVPAAAEPLQLQGRNRKPLLAWRGNYSTGGSGTCRQRV